MGDVLQASHALDCRQSELPVVWTVGHLAKWINDGSWLGWLRRCVGDPGVKV